MKSLVEWTQSKLREAEAKNYELEVEMQKCRVTTENTPGSKDFPHELAQKYIEMHNALNQKLENLKASLEGENSVFYLVSRKVHMSSKMPPKRAIPAQNRMRICEHFERCL